MPAGKSTESLRLMCGSRVHSDIQNRSRLERLLSQMAIGKFRVTMNSGGIYSACQSEFCELCPDRKRYNPFIECIQQTIIPTLPTPLPLPKSHFEFSITLLLLPLHQSQSNQDGKGPSRLKSPWEKLSLAQS